MHVLSNPVYGLGLWKIVEYKHKTYEGVPYGKLTNTIGLSAGIVGTLLVTSSVR